MAVYEFKGIYADSGKAAKGYRDADNPKALRGLLRRDGILLTAATEGGDKSTKQKRQVDWLAPFRRVKVSELAVLTRQLATLVRAGIPLVESIGALTEQVEKELLVKVLTEVREDLNEGTSFSKSLEAHPKVFPPLYINMVAAGEASGTLEVVLERLADFIENQSRLQGKVSSALVYPAAMGVFGTLIVGLLMAFVVPKVTAIFDSLGQALPWYTGLLILVSNIISGYWWLLLLVGGGSFYWFRRWKSKPAGRLKWDTFLLVAPIFGKLNLLVGVARFSRTLATLLQSGVPLLKAMEIGRNVLGNTRLEGVIAEATASIREGQSIAEPLRRSKWFPPMVVHMIAVGERSGQLEQMLENVSRAYEADVETRVTTLTSLLEPLMIIVMGGIVGFIAMAILMPLIQMNELVQ